VNNIGTNMFTDRIKHERFLTLLNDERRRADRKNSSLLIKTVDLENKLERTVHDKMTMEIMNHNLMGVKDHLQHNLDNEVRRCQREKEKLETDHHLQLESRKLKNKMELESSQRKADEAKQKLLKQIEKLTSETAKLMETIRAKDAMISELKMKFKDEMEQKEQQMIEELEEKIRIIQTLHDQDIIARDLVEKKLCEEKKNLTKDIADLQDENENNLAHQRHEFQQTLKNTMEEVNENWRKKCDDIEQQKLNNERALKDAISHLEAKINDEVNASEGQWKLILQQKENEMEFMKNNLENDCEKALANCKNLEDEMQKKEKDFVNELKMKLNEREMQVKEECKRKLEDRIKKVTFNLKHEMDTKERYHKCQMETKINELATVEESLARATAKKSEIEKKLRQADRDFCKDQINRVTGNETTRNEDMARKIFRFRRFNVDSD